MNNFRELGPGLEFIDGFLDGFDPCVREVSTGWPG